jgi:hypothetical protein
MSATAFIASINSNEAATAQDSTTLSIKLMCGGLITLKNFGNPSQMEAVAQVIIDAVHGEPEPEYLVPTTPVAVDSDSDQDSATDSKGGVSNKGGDASSEDSSKEESPGSPESSFESFDGYGLTQEINF